MLGLDDDVVDIDLDVASDLVLKAGLHHALVRGTSVLEPEGHSCVVVNTMGCDEGSFLLVFDFHPNLVVA